MPIRVECPACKKALGAPDSPANQRLRCPLCGHIFNIDLKPLADPDRAPLRRTARNEASPPVNDFGNAPSRRAIAPQTRTDERRGIEPARTADRPVPSVGRGQGRRSQRGSSDESEAGRRESSRLPVGLLVGLGVGVAGLFFLILGGVLLAWLLSSSDKSPPVAAPQVAQGNATPKPQPANGDPAAAAPELDRPRVVEDAAVVDGNEEYVDLPERSEAIPGVAGLNPEHAEERPQDPPARSTVQVVLTNGIARHKPGRPGMYFHVNYRFAQGAPTGTMRYSWVIFTARGRSFVQRINPGTLAQQGSLDGQITAIFRTDAPFRTFLIAETQMPGRPGLQQVRISGELIIR